MSGEILLDPLSGRHVLLSPGRSARPQIVRKPLPRVTDDDLETCPFCEGREGLTPDEHFALGRPPGIEPNAPGWKVRVVPNLMRALPHQEIVVHAPGHVDSLADLSWDQRGLVGAAWCRCAEIGRTERRGYLHVFVNEGPEAGMTLSHTHSQLYWLPRTPPIVRREQQRFERPCPLCSEISGAERDGRVIAEHGGVVLFAPSAARMAYELMIAPHDHAADAFRSEGALVAAVCLLGDSLARLYGAVDYRPPLNAWIHSLPSADHYHWHIEVLPRIAVPAGLELGAGIFLNTRRPEDVAAQLREAVTQKEPERAPWTQADIAAELGALSKERNLVEARLRQLILGMVRFDSHAHPDRPSAAERLTRAVPPDRRGQIEGLPADTIIERLYWIDLRNIVNKEWELFASLFRSDKRQFLEHCDVVNRRPDAHAKAVDALEVARYRESLRWLAETLDTA